MYYSLVSAKQIEGHRLAVEFEDGRAGVVDIGVFIAKGGVFARLADEEVFRKFKINRDFGVLSWGDEVDIAPERLYEETTSDVRCVAEPKPLYGSGA